MPSTETLIEVSESDRSFSSCDLKQSKTTQTTNSKGDEILKRKAIVIDITGGLIKVGFAGENAPSVVFPTLIGRSKSDSMKLHEIYFGDEAAVKQDVLAMTSPMKNGIVTNWDDSKNCWNTLLAP